MAFGCSLGGVFQRERKGVLMALMKTWYTLEEIEGQFGIGRGRLTQWVEEGLVRVEREGKKISKVNVDDVRLVLQGGKSRS